MQITADTLAGIFSPTAYESNSAQFLHDKEKREVLPVPAEKTKNDQVSLSDEAKLLSANDNSEKTQAADEQLKDPSLATSQSGKPLTEEQQLEVEDLKRRDAEVRAHEQAHMSASGGLAQGGAQFSYENGPDGKRYAVGGEVSIDISTVSGDPQATLIKAQKIRRAALAPADPSSQDRSVAADATSMEAQARVELSRQGKEKQSESIAGKDPEADFLASSIKQNEKNIQDSYKNIQNTQVLQQQRNFVDFFV
ncbi:MAG: hypothetical protein KZQ83_19990 [gamma proteobacterium symbiont of Taylorina sp.]|nr:hypothetical protein [gamma proteobacterium symbiont of Taylorina sp.]